MLQSVKNFIKLLFIKKIIGKKLKRISSLPINKIQLALVLVNDSNDCTLSFKKKLATTLKIPIKSIEVISRNPTPENSNNNTFSIEQKDISTLGSINGELEQILSKEYDIQINLFENNDIILNYISLSTLSKLRIGFSTIEKEYNNLVFDFSKNKLDLLLLELPKYLNALIIKNNK